MSDELEQLRVAARMEGKHSGERVVRVNVGLKGFSGVKIPRR